MEQMVKQETLEKENKLDYSDLEKKLETLTGYDYDRAENEERLAGSIVADITLSAGFQSRLAARALGVSLSTIKGLKISDYKTVTGIVSNFLYGNLAEMAKARLTNSEK